MESFHLKLERLLKVTGRKQGSDRRRELGRGTEAKEEREVSEKSSSSQKGFLILCFFGKTPSDKFCIA